MAVVFVVLVIAAATHMFNMFGYPYYENDEGIYMSQAWSLVTQGELSPYTYWYDHAPVGWMTIAGWTQMTGGFFTFGTSVNSGRALMFVLHVASAVLLFFIARRLSRNHIAGALAVFLFSVSPLAIYYQRRVLLDNMMIFWVLVTLAILLKTNLRLWHVFASAVTFAIAVLTKESAIFFLPAFLYVLYVRRSYFTQKLIVWRWLAVSGAVMALYPLYALMRGEFFSKKGVIDVENGLSLIDTLLWQASRGSGLPFWHQGSEFMHVLKGWLFFDPYLVVGGIVITVVFIGWSFFNIRVRLITLFLVCGWLFLLRGKVVLAFYIIPLIPFITLAVGLTVAEIMQYLKRYNHRIYYSALIVLTLLVTVPSATQSYRQYTVRETAPQVAAITWVRQNLPADAKLIIDDYGYVDYHDQQWGVKVSGKPDFMYADTFWKVESDTYLKESLYQNDWKEVEYIVASSTLHDQVQGGGLTFIGEAYAHTRELQRWRAEDNDYAYWTAVRKVEPALPADFLFKESTFVGGQLAHSWTAYKESFIHNYGQVIDPRDDSTTSEGQSYAMLRAVWMDDKDVFDGVWQWTQDHLQFRTDDTLFSWKWSQGALADPNNATDGDEDIALALLFAYAQWGEERYLRDAVEVIQDLWNHAVVPINGRYYLLSARREIIAQPTGYFINPSYFSPASYRIFADVDPEHNWQQLADDTYAIVHDIGQMPGNSTYLPLDWVFVDKNTGVISSAQPYFNHEVDQFSFDAFRTLWRISLDYQWFQTPAARTYLERVNIFLAQEYAQRGILSMSIAPDGALLSHESSQAVNAGYIASLMVASDRTLAEKFYKEQINAAYNNAAGSWGREEFYYDANWAWFGTALYNGDLTNLWAK